MPFHMVLSALCGEYCCIEALENEPLIENCGLRRTHKNSHGSDGYFQPGVFSDRRGTGKPFAITGFLKRLRQQLQSVAVSDCGRSSLSNQMLKKLPGSTTKSPSFCTRATTHCTLSLRALWRKAAPIQARISMTSRIEVARP